MVNKSGLCSFRLISLWARVSCSQLLAVAMAASSLPFSFRSIDDYFANINMLSEVPEDTVNNFIESVKFFWFPYQLEVSYKTVLVRNYIVYSMPSSGRCFFLNPIDRKCFIYPARPDTCRLCPFTESTDATGKISLELAMKNCPGISQGASNLEREEIVRLREKGLANTRTDIMAYEKYMTDANIKRQKIRRSKHKYKTTEDIQKAIQEYERNWREGYYLRKSQKRSLKGKRFVEPLAELGMIPKYPLLTWINEGLGEKRNER